MTGIKRTEIKSSLLKTTTIGKFAREIEVSKFDVSNYFAGRLKHIAKANKKKIKSALIDRGFLPPVKEREYVVCSLGYKHIKKRELK